MQDRLFPGAYSFRPVPEKKQKKDGEGKNAEDRDYIADVDKERTERAGHAFTILICGCMASMRSMSCR